MILPYLTFPQNPAAVPPPPLRKGVVVRQKAAAPAGPLPYLRYGRCGKVPDSAVRHEIATHKCRCDRPIWLPWLLGRRRILIDG